MDEKEKFYHERQIADIYARAIHDLAGAIRFFATVIEEKELPQSTRRTGR